MAFDFGCLGSIDHVPGNGGVEEQEREPRKETATNSLSILSNASSLPAMALVVPSLVICLRTQKQGNRETLGERDEQHVPLSVLPFTRLKFLKIDDLLLELVFSDGDVLRDPTTILADSREVGRRQKFLEEMLTGLASPADEECRLACRMQPVRSLGLSLGDMLPSCHCFALGVKMGSL